MADTQTHLDYHDLKGRHRTPSFASAHAAHVHLLLNAGKKSRHQLGGVRLSALIEAYGDHQTRRGVGDRSTRQDAARYAVRLNPLLDRPVADVSVEDLEALAEGWKGAMAPSTLRDLAYAVIRLFELAYAKGAVPCNNARTALHPLTRTGGFRITTPAAREDVDRIVERVGLRSRLALNLVMDGFLSEPELGALCLTDFDAGLETMSVVYRIEAGEEVMQPRSAKERTVPLSPGTRALLADWLRSEERDADSPHLFSSHEHRHLRCPIEIHLRRAQYHLRMGEFEVQPQKHSRRAQKRRKPFDRFRPRWSLGDIADMAVVEWYESRVDVLEIQRRCGYASIERLGRFKAFFDEVDRDRSAFEAVDDMLARAMR